VWMRFGVLMVAALLAGGTWVTQLKPGNFPEELSHTVTATQPQNLFLLTDLPLRDSRVEVEQGVTILRLVSTNKIRAATVFLQVNEEDFPPHLWNAFLTSTGSAQSCGELDGCSLTIREISYDAGEYPPAFRDAEPVARETYRLDLSGGAALDPYDGLTIQLVVPDRSTGANPYRRVQGQYAYYTGPSIGLWLQGSPTVTACFNILEPSDIQLSQIAPSSANSVAVGPSDCRTTSPQQISQTIEQDGFYVVDPGAVFAVALSINDQDQQELHLLLAGLFLGLAGALVIEAIKFWD
jgi:hypothetical protein